ncbi:ABC-type glycerol-3-phosphate transport system permease component [Nakamurella sp. UYEF19]|uniref:carbohydrate ABC transporter permease n=1 Tax=Nakamurella sp. UYEF19 TaxID=1756392 RepID=UPI003396437E
MTTTTVPRARRRIRIGSALITLVLVVIAVLMVTPLVWLITTSLTGTENAFSVPPTWIPRPFTTENFRAVPDMIPFGRMALNSLYVAVLSTGGSLLVSIPAAYGFSRVRFRGNQAIFLVMLGALMIPGQLTIIPVFILMNKLGLYNTLAALWLPALINVFAIFFLRQYFKSIPRELDEAARIDGAGHFWILFRMIVPLSGPAISALTVLGFEASWNNYFGPLIFLTSPEKMTLPLGLVTLQGGYGGGPAVIVFAAITMVVLPVLIVFLIFQRYFVASIATAGLKG